MLGRDARPLREIEQRNGGAGFRVFPENILFKLKLLECLPVARIQIVGINQCFFRHFSPTSMLQGNMVVLKAMIANISDDILVEYGMK